MLRYVFSCLFCLVRMCLCLSIFIDKTILNFYHYDVSDENNYSLIMTLFVVKDKSPKVEASRRSFDLDADMANFETEQGIRAELA